MIMTTISNTADLPGDTALVPCVNDRPKTPGLIVNPDADHMELLSGALMRIDQAVDLYLLFADRLDDLDPALHAGISAMARLCTEARAMGEVAVRDIKAMYRQHMAAQKHSSQSCMEVRP